MPHAARPLPVRLCLAAAAAQSDGDDAAPSAGGADDTFSRDQDADVPRSSADDAPVALSSHDAADDAVVAAAGDDDAPAADRISAHHAGSEIEAEGDAASQSGAGGEDATSERTAGVAESSYAESAAAGEDGEEYAPAEHAEDGAEPKEGAEVRGMAGRAPGMCVWLHVQTAGGAEGAACLPGSLAARTCCGTTHNTPWCWHHTQHPFVLSTSLPPRTTHCAPPFCRRRRPRPGSSA